jgi:hypothetical protein
MAAPGVTISIRDGQIARKITKIISYGSGGFGVLTPYHNAHSGTVGKVKVPKLPGGQAMFRIPRSDMVPFTTENKVKLSYHADGFVQFSGEFGGKVISGRDQVTGEPKGVGLMSHPLNNPIWTGPSFGVTVWGLSDFDTLDEPEQAAIVFESDDMYFRRCTPRTATGWHLEVYVFPSRFWGAVRKSKDGYSMQMAFNIFDASTPISYAVIEMKVIDLPDTDFLLAGSVSRIPIEFKSPSGWHLSGPGNHDATGQRWVLWAFYPRLWPDESDDVSLDRPPGGTSSSRDPAAG